MTSYRLWIKSIFVPPIIKMVLVCVRVTGPLEPRILLFWKKQNQAEQKLERKHVYEYLEVESDRKTNHMKSFNPLLSLIVVKYLSL